MRDQSQRVQFLDVMRGVAVAVMVMGHSIDSVLSVGVRASEAFRLYDAVRGFTAPIFLFVAGYAFSIVTERRWESFHALRAPAGRRLLKILLLFVVGYALHFPFFSLEKLLHNTRPEEYAQFFQVDVLHCLAASLLLAQLLVLVLPTPRAVVLAAATMAALAVLGAPLVWQVDCSELLSPLVAPYVNGRVLTIFPIFPYAGFLFSGIVIGHYFLEAEQKKAQPAFVKKLLIIGLLAIMAGIIFDTLPWGLYPSHDFWKTSPNFFVIRLGVVLLVTAGFLSLKRLPSFVTKQIVALGQASLLVYAAHLLLVYGSAANDGLMQRIGQVLSYFQAAGVGLAVLAAMIVLVHAWNYSRSNYLPFLRFAQAAATSLLLFHFLTRPW